MNLPNDICRCHDESCSMRKKCMRFLYRKNGGENTPHSDSLKENGQCWNFTPEAILRIVPEIVKDTKS